MDSKPAQTASPQDGYSTPPHITVPASASTRRHEAALALLQLANTPVPAQAPSLASSQRTATLERSLSPPCILIPTSSSPEQYWSEQAALRRAILAQADADEPAQTPSTVDPRRLVKVEGSHSPPPASKSPSQLLMERDLEHTKLDCSRLFPSTPSAEVPTVPDRYISDEELKSCNFGQLPSHLTPSSREMSATPNQKVPRESWEDLVNWGEDPDLSPAPLAKLPLVWQRPEHGSLSLPKVPAPCPETKPVHGLKPGSKDPFMGSQFPCKPDDEFREFADSSLDARFDFPEQPFGPTATKAEVEETMCDMTRELDQVQAIRDQLWKDIESTIVIGQENEVIQIICRRVFLQAVNAKITDHQAWIYFRGLFATHKPMSRQCRSLLSQGAVPFAQESHRFKRYAREHLNKGDVFSGAVDDLMLAPMDTKKAILEEMLRRKGLKDGKVWEEEPIKTGMFVVPPVLPAEIRNLFVRLQSVGLPFNGALQMVALFAKV